MFPSEKDRGAVRPRVPSAPQRSQIHGRARTSSSMRAVQEGAAFHYTLLMEATNDLRAREMPTHYFAVTPQEVLQAQQRANAIRSEHVIGRFCVGLEAAICVFLLELKLTTAPY